MRARALALALAIALTGLRLLHPRCDFCAGMCDCISIVTDDGGPELACPCVGEQES